MHSNDNPYFSIIVPIFNAEKYLDECIESVISQDFQSWELLLVDDGSTDSSIQVCEKYSHDNRIRIFHKENGGEFSSRLLAVNNAQGDYTLGLDADDCMEIGYLSVIKKYLDEGDYDCLMWSFTQFEERKGKVRLNQSWIREYDGRDFLHFVLKSTLHSFCSKALKTSILRGVDFSSVPNVRMSEDYVMIIPTLCKIKKARIIDYYGYKYRIHSNSASMMPTAQKIMDMCEVSNYGVSVLRSNGISDAKYYIAEYAAFLRSILPRLLLLIENDEISESDFQNIWNHPAYIASSKGETKDNFDKQNLICLRMIRHKEIELLSKMLSCN